MNQGDEWKHSRKSVPVTANMTWVSRITTDDLRHKIGYEEIPTYMISIICNGLMDLWSWNYVCKTKWEENKEQFKNDYQLFAKKTHHPRLPLSGERIEK